MRRRKWDDTVFPIPPRAGQRALGLEGDRKPLGLALATFALIGLLCVGAVMIAVHTADLQRQVNVLQQGCQK
jgi:hypothetical protein